MPKLSLLRRMIAEVVGTFTLVLIGPMAASVDIITAPDHLIGHGALVWIGIGICFGLAVMIGIYAIGHISGAHINPAVTIALWVIRRFPGREVLPYIVAQLVGAIIAGFTQRAILYTQLDPIGGIGVTNLGTTDLFPRVLRWQGLPAEVVYTAILLFVIVGVAIGRRASAGFAGLAIGMAVAALVAFGGQVDGCSMNPARTLGPALASMHWTNHWIYWIGPIAGALIGACVYYYTFLKGPSEDSPKTGNQGH
ncbi:MIP/aquaporin family protein [Chloroflexota bacterium]